METSEENVSELIEENSYVENVIELVNRKPRFVKLLIKAGIKLLLISVFVFFFMLIFMSHTYSYHL